MELLHVWSSAASELYQFCGVGTGHPAHRATLVPCGVPCSSCTHPSSQGIQPWAENRTASQELGVWVTALGTNSDTGGVGIAVVGGWREEMSVCGLCLTREMLFPMCQGVSVPLCLQLCPARPQLTLSWYPQEVVVSRPRCSDPCRMGPPWAERPRAKLGLS